MISEINAVLKFVLENPHSDFYRKKYGVTNPTEFDSDSESNSVVYPEFYPVKSYDDFQKIPFLKKEEFALLSIDERTFVPENEIKYFSVSSGTSNTKKPTILPHSDFNFDTFLKYAYPEKEILSLGVRKLMILRPPISPPFFKFMALPKNGTVVAPGDLKNLDLSAKLAKQLGVSGFIITPTILDSLIISLEKTDFSFASIKYIILGGEYCSKQKMNYFKNIFPNARFNLIYGSSEFGGPCGYQCEYLKEKLGQYHITDSLLVEITTDGKVSKTAEQGTITVTDLKTKAFPLIRYETDDIGSLLKEECNCREKHILLLDGRANFDIIKFHGITLNSQAIENSLESVSDYIHPNDFQMHIWEKNIGEKLKPHLIIDLRLKEKYEKNSQDPMFKEKISAMISARLKLSMKSNLKQLVENGIFLPLEINFPQKWLTENIKSKHIISHLF